MDEKYMAFKFFFQEEKTKMLLTVMLAMSLLTNLVLAIGSCLN